MATYAIINNGVVKNVISANAEMAANHTDWVPVPEGTNVKKGDLWNGTVFTPAPPDTEGKTNQFKREVLALLRRTDWTQVESHLTAPRKLQWKTWRDDLVAAARAANWNPDGFVPPVPPGDFDADQLW